MKKLSEIANTPSLNILIGISIFYFFLILVFKNPKPVYGDGGLMYLQTKQIVDSGFSTFQFDYKGSDYDKEGRYAPYTKPFLGKVKGSYYIDFPPYFPILNSLFYKIFNNRGLYFLSFTSLVLSLFFLIQIGDISNLNVRQKNLLLILFAFCTSIPLYNFTYHEYPLAIFAFITALYFLIKSFQNIEPSTNLLYFGFLAGISLFFRLELMFVYLALGIGYLLFKQNNIVKPILLIGSGFCIPFLFLIGTNVYLHEHPLGLRYVLTLENSKNLFAPERLHIIQMMLFSPLRGIFFQSSFTILTIALIFFRKTLSSFEKFLIFSILISFTLILLTSPNDGDHIAPRYLFGTFPLFCILFVILISKIEILHKNKILFTFILASMLFSSYNLFKNIKWLATSDKNVTIFNEKIKNLPEQIIIFREFASPLNLQNTYSDKIFFVAQTENELNRLIAQLIEKKAHGFIIADSALLSLVSKNSKETTSNDPAAKNNEKKIKLVEKIQNSPFIFSHFQILANE